LAVNEQFAASRENPEPSEIHARRQVRIPNHRNEHSTDF